MALELSNDSFIVASACGDIFPGCDTHQRVCFESQPAADLGLGSFFKISCRMEKEASMCDYSLASVPNRLAQAGEELVVHRFNTGALGLASKVDVSRRHQESRTLSLWSKFKRFCEVPFDPYLPDQQVPAVCIPPGTKLLLRDLPPRLQREYRCAEVEEVVFTQTSADAYDFRDAVLFRHGAQVLLQRLKEGQRVRVLFLVRSEDMEPTPIQSVFSR